MVSVEHLIEKYKIYIPSASRLHSSPTVRKSGSLATTSTSKACLPLNTSLVAWANDPIEDTEEMARKRKANTERKDGPTTGSVKKPKISEEVMTGSLTLEKGLSNPKLNITTLKHDALSSKKRPSFLDFPGEIRNEIYKWIFPRPGNPKLMCIDWMWSKDEPRRICGAERLSLGIYRKCKTIYQECPSLEWLLRLGAIIPTVTVDAWAFKPWYCFGGQWPSEQVLKKMLYPASHLRIRSDNIFKAEGDFHLTAWSLHAEACWMMETFLGASNPSLGRYSLMQTDDKVDDKVDDTAGNAESAGRQVTICNKEKKVIQVSAPIAAKSGNLSSIYQGCLFDLFEVICHKELLENLEAVQLRVLKGKYKPFCLRRLNQQAEKWLSGYKKFFLEEADFENISPPALTAEESEKLKSDTFLIGDTASEGHPEDSESDEYGY